MDEISTEYLAGFFDGEGSVGIYPNKNRSVSGKSYRLQVSIGQVDSTVLRFLKERFGGTLTLYERSKTMENRKDAWYWFIHARRALVFLEEIRPYTIVKRNEIELAVEFMENKMRPGQRYSDLGIEDTGPEYCQKMKDLKRIPLH